MANLGQELAAGLAAFHAARARKRTAARDDLQTLLVQAKIAEALRRTAEWNQPIAADPTQPFTRDPVTGRALANPAYLSPQGQLAQERLNRIRAVQPGPTPSLAAVSAPATLGRSLGTVSAPEPDTLVATKYVTDAYGITRPKELISLRQQADANARTLAFERQRTAQKPLEAASAAKVEAGIQGTENAQDLINTFGFVRQPNGAVTAPNFLRKKLQLTAAGLRVPPNVGFPGLNKTIEGLAGLFAGNTGKILDLALTTLAKNVYRSETGAAGSEVEINDVKRRLITRMTDSEHVALERILSSADFVRGAAELIRPGSVKPLVIPSTKTPRGTGRFQIEET